MDKIDKLIENFKRTNSRQSVSFSVDEMLERVNPSKGTGPVIDTIAIPKQDNGCHYCIPLPDPELPRDQLKRKFSYYIDRANRANSTGDTSRKGKALTNATFSEAFYNLLSGPDQEFSDDNSDIIVYKIFWRAHLEQRAMYILRNSPDSDLAKFIQECMKFYGIRETSDNRLQWKISGECEGTDFIPFIAAIFECSQEEATSALEEILGQKFENLHKMRSAIQAKYESRPSRESIPNVLATSFRGLTIIKQLSRYNVLSAAGNIIGAYLLYKVGDKELVLLASVHDNELCIGSYKPVAMFLNQHLMDANPGAIIILFDSIQIAMAVKKRLDELSGYNPAEFVVTSHTCDDLKQLPWSYFLGHPVVYIPATSKSSIAKAKDYIQFIKGSNAASFKVAAQLFLRGKIIDNGQSPDLKDTEEARLLREAVCVTDCANIIDTLRKAIANALDKKSYERYGRQLGIFRSDSNTSEQDAAPATSMLPAPPESFNLKKALTYIEIQIAHTLKPGTYIIIAGIKGAGKTHLILGICVNILMPGVVWPLFPLQGKFTENICIVDGETLDDEIKENLEQHGLIKFLDKRLFVLSRNSYEKFDFCNNLSLRDQAFRDGLMAFILKHRCRYLFLDSLGALTEEEPNTCHRQVQEFIKQLQKMGVGVILTNHNRQNDKKNQNTGDMATRMRANEDYFNFARVVINIIDTDEIKTLASIPDTLRDYANKKNGLTLGLQYKHHKTAPCIQGRTIFLHLPLGGCTWKFLFAAGVDDIPEAWGHPECQAVEQTVCECSASEASNTHKYDEPEKVGNADRIETIKKTLANLHPNARKVYEAIRDKGGSATRSDLDELCKSLNCEPNAQLNILIEAKLIERCGSGKNTFYRII